MAMRIGTDTVVTLTYELLNADGESLEEDNAQVEYLLREALARRGRLPPSNAPQAPSDSGAAD